MTEAAEIAKGRQFPVLLPYRERTRDGRQSIPWAVIAPHEAQAERNHRQSLTCLAERGGLSWCEMAAVLEDRRWHRMNDADAKVRVLEIVRNHLKGSS